MLIHSQKRLAIVISFSEYEFPHSVSLFDLIRVRLIFSHPFILLLSISSTWSCLITPSDATGPGWRQKKCICGGGALHFSLILLTLTSVLSFPPVPCENSKWILWTEINQLLFKKIQRQAFFKWCDVTGSLK